VNCQCRIDVRTLILIIMSTTKDKAKAAAANAAAAVGAAISGGPETSRGGHVPRSLKIMPLRDANDFLFKARFELPSPNKSEDAVIGRILNNLIYYQTNYFIVVGGFVGLHAALRPKGMLQGQIGFLGLLINHAITSQIVDAFKTSSPATVTVAKLGSLLATLGIMYKCPTTWNYLAALVAPVTLCLGHAFLRKRNWKNKLSNLKERIDFVDDKITPMRWILVTIESTIFGLSGSEIERQILAQGLF